MDTRIRKEEAGKSISIIIPVYNEIGNIYSLMDSLEKFKGKCEIIFVDGGSSDGTVPAVEKRYKILKSPKKSRASQMNFGASLSSGSILLFLHGDSILEKGALEEIKSIIGKGYKVGCFKIKFDSKSLLMKACGFMSNIRVALRNIAFGDQGIFIDKDYFHRLGGYKEIPLMEDYQLSMDIKADGEKIKQGAVSIVTSARRFEKNGKIKTMARMQKLQYMYRRGDSIEKISNLYK